MAHFWRLGGALSALVLVSLASREGAAGGKAVEGIVNLNTAAPELLASLPGIGPAKAVGIIAYRRRHPFRTVDELVRVKGIGRKMVRAMRNSLAVAGPSTAHAVTTSARFAEASAVPPPPPPKPPPPLCRPVAQTSLPAAVVRAARVAQNRVIRSAANHCSAPP